jgi:hypothetical protein
MNEPNGLKRVGIQIRKGSRYRNLPLPARDAAIVFTLSNGKKVEVDLHETASGNLLLRPYNGKVSVANQTDGCAVAIVD